MTVVPTLSARNERAGPVATTSVEPRPAREPGSCLERLPQPEVCATDYDAIASPPEACPHGPSLGLGVRGAMRWDGDLHAWTARAVKRALERNGRVRDRLARSCAFDVDSSKGHERSRPIAPGGLPNSHLAGLAEGRSKRVRSRAGLLARDVDQKPTRPQACRPSHHGAGVFVADASSGQPIHGVAVLIDRVLVGRIDGASAAGGRRTQDGQCDRADPHGCGWDAMAECVRWEGHRAHHHHLVSLDSLMARGTRLRASAAWSAWHPSCARWW
jgi:hypothetical protein